MTVGERLREERRRSGLSQGDFARKGGVGRNSQSEYEADKTAPNTTYLESISKVGADAAYIVTGKRGADSLNERLTALVAEFEQLSSEWQEVVIAVIRQAAAPSSVS